jgi:hypothetical protein
VVGGSWRRVLPVTETGQGQQSKLGDGTDEKGPGRPGNNMYGGEQEQQWPPGYGVWSQEEQQLTSLTGWPHETGRLKVLGKLESARLKTLPDRR